MPADRARVGLSLQSAIWENMAVGHLRACRKGPFLSGGAARQRCRDLIGRFDIRGASAMTPARAVWDEGRAVFVISADLDELLSLCDRILVIYRGQIVGDFPAAGADIDDVGQLMGGFGHASRPVDAVEQRG